MLKKDAVDWRRVKLPPGQKPHLMSQGTYLGSHASSVT